MKLNDDQLEEVYNFCFVTCSRVTIGALLNKEHSVTCFNNEVDTTRKHLLRTLEKILGKDSGHASGHGNDKTVSSLGPTEATEPGTGDMQLQEDEGSV